MANPWTRKNPFLSMMMSGANAWMGAARGIMAGQARGQQAKALHDATRQATALWTGALTGAAKGRRGRKKPGA